LRNSKLFRLQSKGRWWS